MVKVFLCSPIAGRVRRVDRYQPGLITLYPVTVTQSCRERGEFKRRSRAPLELERER